MILEQPASSQSDESQDQLPRRFTLAELGTAIVAIGVVLSAARMVMTWQENHLLEWILVAVGIALLAVLLAIQRNMKGAELSAAGGIVFFVAWSSWLPAREAAHAMRQTQCRGHLKQIVMALHWYHDEYGSFPPAVVRDRSGRPMHSWRVLLLPYLEQQTLYNQYRFDEPWNGPNNQSLHRAIMRVYSCPAEGANLTNTSFVLVTGPGTAFPPDGCTSLALLAGGTREVPLVVELRNSGIHWLEPRDLDVSALEQFARGEMGSAISGEKARGANAAMTDGSVEFLDAQRLEKIGGALRAGGGQPAGDQTTGPLQKPRMP